MKAPWYPEIRRADPNGIAKVFVLHGNGDQNGGAMVPGNLPVESDMQTSMRNQN